MLSLLDILRRIDSGATSPEAALRLSQEAIAARDGELKAFVQRAQDVSVPPSGAFRGVAVGVKDIIDTADLPTEMGSPLYAGWRPRADAPIVTALKQAGAAVLGKTATTPFAHLDPTPTRNPRHPDHTPGGSSSGSAAAVGAGLVPLALGTQTGGSIIRPASFCGVAAIKPSYRLIPTVGVKCFSWTLDTVGLFAATVADCAVALAVVTGRADLRIDGRMLTAPRIGVVDQDFAGAPEPESAAALEEAIRLAEAAGAIPCSIRLPPIVGEAYAMHGIVQDFEARQALAWEYQHHDALSPLLRAQLDGAQLISPDAYDNGRRTAHRARAALAQVFEECDVLLTFSAPGPAPKGLGSTGDSRFNRLWTLMGGPCVNVPGLGASNGLPVGVQVIAPFGRDDRALMAASFVEHALKRAA